MTEILDKRLHHFIEQDKITQGVFDRPTLLTLYSLLKKDHLEQLDSIIKTGKEANVYSGSLGEKTVAVKIYAIETSDFKKMVEYIRSDPRFELGNNKRKIVYQWAQKEFRNLKLASKIIACPQPIAVLKNILIMDFIGEGSNPAPKLKDAILDDPEATFADVVSSIKKLYAGGLVHGDLSEYNILYHEGPVFIDFSMGVTVKHPLADKLLGRDVKNVVKFFKKWSVESSDEDVFKHIRG